MKSSQRRIDASSSHGPSFLRWAGSKRKALAYLAAAYGDSRRRYIEPFAGSAALFFHLRPDHAVLGDLNGHLVNAMRQVRDQPEVLFRKLVAIERSKEAYYSNRLKFNSLPPTGLDSAVLFVYLNRNCFNGLWRTNSSGLFNVPHGGDEMGSTPPLELFRSCSRALKKSKLRHQDFRKTIAGCGDEEFIYADPPYFSSEDRTFVEYGKKSFDKHELSDLIQSLVDAELRGSDIALTYSEAMPLPNIPNHWVKTVFEVTRNVGGFKGSRKKHSEVLYTSQALNS